MEKLTTERMIQLQSPLTCWWYGDKEGGGYGPIEQVVLSVDTIWGYWQWENRGEYTIMSFVAMRKKEPGIFNRYRTVFRDGGERGKYRKVSTVGISERSN